jgi:putative ABC transport system substrate-binding protein
MRLIGLAVVLALPLLLAPLASGAQQADEARRIGWLALNFPPNASFLQGLLELGWIEGQNLRIESRLAGGDRARLPDLANELLRLRVEIIVAGDSAAIGPARQVTKTLPIVMTVSGDPVMRGFVASLGRPGGNVTGLANLSPELVGKRLELLRELVPRLKRVAVLGEPDHLDWRPMDVATATVGVQLQALKVGNREGFEGAFQLATSKRAEGLVVLPSPLTNTYMRTLVGLAAKTRLPAVCPLRQYAEVGGLIAYGPSIPELHRRAATYVDRILRGAKPADLPVEQPTKFELVINLKTAKALGLTIPQSVLIRADQLIE